MLQSIYKDIKQMFSTSHMVNKLIIFVLAFSILYFINNALSKGFNFNFSNHLFLSSDLTFNLKHPWVFITHLFIARSIYEMIWLLLLFYWFGSILGDLLGDNKILPVYLLSGILGSSFFLLSANILQIDYFYISGLESAVIGTLVSAAVLSPDYNMNLILLGKVRIKYIVIAVIVINLLFLYAGSRYQYLTFPGAILAGWYYIVSIKSGKGLHIPINNIISGIRNFFKYIFRIKKNSLKVEHRSSSIPGKDSTKRKEILELNRILDKVRENGYDNLTESEKQFLFKVSNEK